jgi:hypothetical protein
MLNISQLQLQSGPFHFESWFTPPAVSLSASPIFFDFDPKASVVSQLSQQILKKQRELSR